MRGQRGAENRVIVCHSKTHMPIVVGVSCYVCFGTLELPRLICAVHGLRRQAWSVFAHGCSAACRHGPPHRHDLHVIALQDASSDIARAGAPAASLGDDERAGRLYAGAISPSFVDLLQTPQLPCSHFTCIASCCSEAPLGKTSPSDTVVHA